jgi:hypothetical protein
LTSVLAALAVALVPTAAQAKTSKLSAPTVTAPADGATVEAFPAFTWKAVKHADRYQIQVAADAHFTAPAGIFSGNTGLFTTTVTAATTSKSASDGTYYWRVRGLRPTGSVGRWSTARKVTKEWTTPPVLQSADGLAVSWPALPLLLNWSAVPHAVKYLVIIATDPGMSNVVAGSKTSPLAIFGTSFALPSTLAAGHYYWTVTPVDAEGFKGQTSGVGQFDWAWPTGTTLAVSDLDSDPRVFDPQFSWNAVPGAARYEVEINAAQDFAPDSKWCCSDKAIGTSLSPQHVLANNNGYYARVRAFDVDGNAGAWNVYNGGGTFPKGFDVATPTIPNLRLSDAAGHSLAAGDATEAPVVRWDPVPGANEYEVQTVPFSGGCSYTNPHIMHTASIAWTPLGYGTNLNYPPQTDSFDPDAPPSGSSSWCLRVRALSDNDSLTHQMQPSDWTELTDSSGVAFTFQAQADPGTPLLNASASDYLTPVAGSANVRTPLLMWKPVQGAHSYLVVISRDDTFTNIADAAITEIPAYAPRQRGSGARLAEPLTDETTGYYWAVFPSSGTQAAPITTHYYDNQPQTFNKNSVPPTPLGPQSGSDVSTQPTFHWTEAEGARNYHLQVATDPTFSQPLDDVVTDSTAFTSINTYPADTTLYWRVRGNDVNNNGLNWSPTGTFTRRLPIPSYLPDNPTSGSGVPVLSWAPVQGAIGYDIHADNGDGTTSDGSTRSTIFSSKEIWGTGLFHYKIRAVFPSSDGGDATGPYTDLQPFTRTFGPVTGVNALRSPSRVLLSWDGYTGAKSYQADISTTDSFDHRIASVRTDGTVWAPDLKNSPGGRMYYRVAPVDTHGNYGAEVTGTFTLPKVMHVSLSGVLTSGKPSLIRITARDAAGHVVKKAKVTITGAGMPTKRVRLNQHGQIAVTLTPHRRGTVTFLAHLKGYVDGTALGTVR